MKPYPELKRYSTARLKQRLSTFKANWTKARKGGMRLDSFSAIYLATEIERVQTAIEDRHDRK